jgi:hypothetical protein
LPLTQENRLSGRDTEIQSTKNRLSDNGLPKIEDTDKDIIQQDRVINKDLFFLEEIEIRGQYTN